MTNLQKVTIESGTPVEALRDALCGLPEDACVVAVQSADYGRFLELAIASRRFPPVDENTPVPVVDPKTWLP